MLNEGNKLIGEAFPKMLQGFPLVKTGLAVTVLFIQRLIGQVRLFSRGDLPFNSWLCLTRLYTFSYLQVLAKWKRAFHLMMRC